MVASGTSEDCKGSETKGLRVAPGHAELAAAALARHGARPAVDRKSTRLNSSHVSNSYAVFCLKKKSFQAPVVLAKQAVRSGPAHQSFQRAGRNRFLQKPEGPQLLYGFHRAVHRAEGGEHVDG